MGGDRKATKSLAGVGNLTNLRINFCFRSEPYLCKAFIKLMNFEREKLQDLIREVVVLNTEVGESATAFRRRYKALKEKVKVLHKELDDKIKDC